MNLQGLFLVSFVNFQTFKLSGIYFGVWFEITLQFFPEDIQRYHLYSIPNSPTFMSPLPLPVFSCTGTVMFLSLKFYKSFLYQVEQVTSFLHDFLGYFPFVYSSR